MSTKRAQAGDNFILSQLTDEEHKRLTPHFSFCDLELHTVLYEAARPVHKIYFPTSGIISLVLVLEDGSTGEIAILGKEGMSDTAAFMPAYRPVNSAVVQAKGQAVTLPIDVLRKELNQQKNFQKLVLRYSQALLGQISYTAICNRHHTIVQQLARWLLLSSDVQGGGRDVTMTQEMIANMLGVRREGVTTAAGTLQKTGIISYRRGKITIKDRAALVEVSCECYTNITSIYKNYQEGGM